jgi:hypothetical protein
MFRLPELTIWVLTILADAFVVYLFSFRKLFRELAFLSSYFLLLVTVGVLRCVFLAHFGSVSTEYGYFYFWSEALLEVSLFLSIVELSGRVARRRMPRRSPSYLSVVALLAATCLSLLAAMHYIPRGVTPFLVELAQASFYLSCIVILAACAWKFWNGSDHWIAGRIVSVLCVYLLLLALTSNVPIRRAIDFSTLQNLAIMATAWLPLGTGFALVTHNDRSR